MGRRLARREGKEARGRRLGLRGPAAAADDKEKLAGLGELAKTLKGFDKIGTIYVISHSSGAKFLRIFLAELSGQGVTAKVEGWNLNGFAVKDKRVTLVDRLDSTPRGHMKLINTDSTVDPAVKVLTAKPVNADYDSVTPANVYTGYLSSK